MANRRPLVLLLGLWLVNVWCTALQADISIDGYTDATNDRFTNSTEFVMAGFDLSGVGQVSSGRWATAISRNVVISAEHFSPGTSDTVTFFAGNDPTQAPVRRQILSREDVPGTDLMLIVLNGNLPSNIKHYTYAREALAGTPPQAGVPWDVADAGIYQGLNAYLFGRSPKSNEAFQDQAVGRNVVSGFSENVPFGNNPDVDSIVFTRDESTSSDFVEFEARFVVGDSGGPTFVDLNGELTLLGTNAFIYDSGAFETTGPGSGINYIGNQAGFIDEFILANAVPEPSGVIWVAAGVLGLLRRRRGEQDGAVTR